MTFLQSILLGLIQGVAEFLPISSSGHLAIAQNLLNINAEVPAFYDVLLHLGTLVAVFVAYWQDICDMVREFFCGIGDLVHHSTPTPVPPARRLILLIILGTLPLFAILPIKDTVEGLKSSMVFIGAALIVTGFLLFFSDRARKGRKDARSATVLDVLENSGNIAVLDTSAACHMPDVLEMPYRPPIAGGGGLGEKAYDYRLGGPTCLAGDVIGDYSFDEPLSPGSRVVFCDMAIYSMVKNNTFNGMNLPAIYLKKQDGSIQLVRKFGYEDFKTRLS